LAEPDNLSAMSQKPLMIQPLTATDINKLTNQYTYMFSTAVRVKYLRGVVLINVRPSQISAVFIYTILIASEYLHKPPGFVIFTP